MDTTNIENAFYLPRVSLSRRNIKSAVKMNSVFGEGWNVEEDKFKILPVCVAI